MGTAYQTLEGPPGAEEERFEAVVSRVGFVLYRDRPRDWFLHELANPRYDILALAVAGRARYECEGVTFDMRRGMMAWFPRGLPHSARSDPKAPWSFYSVGFQLDPAPAAKPAFESLPRHLPMANAPQIVDLFRQLQRLWTRREAGYSMACRGLVSLLMQQYVAAAVRTRQRVPHSERLQAIIQRLHDNVGEVYSVGELARMAGLSESRFRLLFGQLTGTSVTRYQNRLRIQAAQDLLASGQFSVGEVADRLGFRDIYYFSRLFKQMTGMPPSAWRHA